MAVQSTYMAPDTPKLSIKDPVSCLTHLFACIAAVTGTAPMLIHASVGKASAGNMFAIGLFMLSLILLYGASASYHGFNIKGEKGIILKKLDHMMIFVLIAGSYTPYCSIVLGQRGPVLFCVIWALAAAGIVFKFCWVTCPRWVSSVMYIMMGWVVAFEIPRLIDSMNSVSFIWLLSGGIVYTIGGIIYSMKLIHFRNGRSLWGSHEIFHLFVMAGSICHYISIYNLY